MHVRIPIPEDGMHACMQVESLALARDAVKTRWRAYWKSV